MKVKRSRNFSTRNKNRFNMSRATVRQVFYESQTQYIKIDLVYLVCISSCINETHHKRLYKRLYKWELRLMSLYRNKIARWRKTNGPLSVNGQKCLIFYITSLDVDEYISTIQFYDMQANHNKKRLFHLELDISKLEKRKCI